MRGRAIKDSFKPVLPTASQVLGALTQNHAEIYKIARVNDVCIIIGATKLIETLGLRHPIIFAENIKRQLIIPVARVRVETSLTSPTFYLPLRLSNCTLSFFPFCCVYIKLL